MSFFKKKAIAPPQPGALDNKKKGLSWDDIPLSKGYVQMPPVPERYHVLIIQALNAAYNRSGDDEIAEFTFRSDFLMDTLLVTDEYAKNWREWMKEHEKEWSRLK